MGLHYYCHHYAAMRIKHLHLYRLDSRQAVRFDPCRHGQYRTENASISVAGRVALHRSDCHYRGLHQFSPNHLICHYFCQIKKDGMQTVLFYISSSYPSSSNKKPLCASPPTSGAAMASSWRLRILVFLILRRRMT